MTENGCHFEYSHGDVCGRPQDDPIHGIHECGSARHPFEKTQPRLERAKTLPVLHLSERKYRVGKQWVDLDGETMCHCEDALLRGTQLCKHVLAAMLSEERKPGERT